MNTSSEASGVRHSAPLGEWFRSLPPARYVVWIAFIFACFQATVQTPYAVISTSTSANVFTALICGAVLVMALLFLRSSAIRVRRAEILVSASVTCLGVLSAWFGDTREPSLIRVLVIIVPALAGYWTARLLIDCSNSRKVLQWWFLALLVITLVCATAGVAYSGKIHEFIDSHWHPVGSRILLFQYAPLSMLGSESSSVVGFAIAVLGLSYGGLLIAGRYAGMESVVLIPVVLCLLVSCLSKRRSLRTAGLVFLLVAVLALGYIVRQNARNLAKEHQSVAYRVENVFFSLHIAAGHPWLGIGPLGPRGPHLKDYEVRYPYVTTKVFSQWTGQLRTSENTPLTLLVDFGLPFSILYLFSVLYLGWQLIRLSVLPAVRLKPHPMAVLLPLAGAFLHFNVTEGLYQPHISWFFHILLGLVLTLKDEAEAQRCG